MTNKRFNIWPGGIIVTLVIFAIFIVSVAVFISRKNVDLVSKEYYNESVIYNDIMDMKEAFNALENKPSIVADKLSGNVVITFPNEMKDNILDGKLEFYKPDNASLDFEVPIVFKTGNTLIINGESVPKGMWKVKMQFTYGEKAYLNEQQILL